MKLSPTRAGCRERESLNVDSREIRRQEAIAENKCIRTSQICAGPVQLEEEISSYSSNGSVKGMRA
jgi:hypothetical protein